MRFRHLSETAAGTSNARRFSAAFTQRLTVQVGPGRTMTLTKHFGIALSTN
jgi:hypothetical protein